MTTPTTNRDDSQSIGEGGNHPAEPTKPSLFCHGVFAALGLLLLAAAAFKTYEAYSTPMSSVGLLGTLTLVSFEICFGAWLLIGTRSEWTLRMAVACFATFACVAAYKYLTGESSCGCFGTLQVSPAITLVIDAAAVMLLILCRAGVETTSGRELQLMSSRVGTFAIVLSSLAVLVALYGHSRVVRTDGASTRAGDLVLLEPESWIGNGWPLAGELGLTTELATGEWDVLIFRHECHVCHEVMAQLLSDSTSLQKLVLVGVDERVPDEHVMMLEEAGCRLAYLPNDREWFVTTPVRVRLIDGICVSATVIEAWE